MGPADPDVLPANRRHPWQNESLRPTRNGMSGVVLKNRGMFSRMSEVLTEIQGGNPTDEFIDVRRRKARLTIAFWNLATQHAVEKSEQIHWVRSIGCKMGANVSIGGSDACCDCQ